MTTPFLPAKSTCRSFTPASCCSRGIPYMIIFAKQSLLFATQSSGVVRLADLERGELERGELERGELERVKLKRGEDDAARNENGA